MVGNQAYFEALAELESEESDEYRSIFAGLLVMRLVADWFRMGPDAITTDVTGLEKVKAASKLSRSALESLAIIAYKQPIVRAEVEQIRGVETSGVIRTLLERKLVRIVGRKEEPGRPIMYGTTKFFLEHFGLRDLSQLPPLREFRELGESEQAMLPIDESVDVVGQSVPYSSETSAQEQADGAQGEVAPIEVNGTAIEMSEITADAEHEFVAADVVEES